MNKRAFDRVIPDLMETLWIKKTEDM
jgi:hypothetical protein